MKRAIGVAAVVVAALGVWAGATVWRSGADTTKFQAGLAMFVASNLLFSLWAWRRATPGSGDAMVLPGTVLLLVSMLVGIVPRLLWPAAEGVQNAGSIASMVGVTGVFALQIRNRRRLRRAARPV